MWSCVTVESSCLQVIMYWNRFKPAGIFTSPIIHAHSIMSIFCIGMHSTQDTCLLLIVQLPAMKTTLRIKLHQQLWNCHCVYYYYTWNTACDLEDVALASVGCWVRFWFPDSNILRTSAAEEGTWRESPVTTNPLWASSLRCRSPDGSRRSRIASLYTWGGINSWGNLISIKGIHAHIGCRHLKCIQITSPIFGCWTQL